ncbi:MAG: hypothetical protein IIZ43_03360 [Eubacterium sp.]|nr:hypothetical protein [Eubacterium sp.]
MKKQYFAIIITILAVLLVRVFFVIPNTPESLDALLEFEPLSGYETSEENCYSFERGDKTYEDIIVRKCYYEKNGDGLFSVSIGAYKDKDVLTGCRSNYDRSWLNTWTKKRTVSDADGRTVHVGMTGMDDFDSVVLRGWLEDGDYLYEFSMSNGDDFLTKKQEKAFFQMIETVKKPAPSN